MFEWIRKFVARVSWRRAVTVTMVVTPVLLSAHAAFAAVPPARYGTPNGAISGSVSAAIEGLAATIRDILGATALLAIVVAAIMNHFVHSLRAKEQAKEVAFAAIIGLLIAAFAPDIVNFFAAL